jgi:protease YdgD
MPMLRTILVFVLAAIAANAVAQQDSRDAPATAAPAQPGIGERDPRVNISLNVMPWRAVGKLQATNGKTRTSCTATLIGPTTVLTAAHCVFNIRTLRYFQPSSLHFLIGYDHGTYAGHAVGTHLTTSTSYDPRQPLRTLGSDWALLTIDTALGTPDRILSISDDASDPGTAVVIGGYSQDHALVLTADTTCHITGRAKDGTGHYLLRHNCTTPRGVSGAPMLVRDGANWFIVAVAVAAEIGAPQGFAVPLYDFDEQYKAPPRRLQR